MSMIVNHLKALTTDDLDVLCRDISEIQRLSKTTGGNGGNQSRDQKEKEVQLTNTDFKGICGFLQQKSQTQMQRLPRMKEESGRDKMFKLWKVGTNQTKLLESPS